MHRQQSTMRFSYFALSFFSSGMLFGRLMHQLFGENGLYSLLWWHLKAINGKKDNSDVHSQHRKNRTGFYGHNSLVEKQRKRKEEDRERAQLVKGLFDMKQILKSNFDALQTTRRDWVIMENILLFTKYSGGNDNLFIFQFFSVSAISLDFQFPNT